MMPQRFDAETDLPPMPFDERICRLALELKELGLAWKPHVGCFLWDPDHHIQPDSPFPGRIYFILSLPRFVGLLGSLEAITEKLVWLPTWHQARLLCQRFGIADGDVVKARQIKSGLSPCEDLAHVYLSIIDRMRNR
jgi:hypothetical protein